MEADNTTSASYDDELQTFYDKTMTKCEQYRNSERKNKEKIYQLKEDLIADKLGNYNEVQDLIKEYKEEVQIVLASTPSSDISSEVEVMGEQLGQIVIPPSPP